MCSIMQDDRIIDRPQVDLCEEKSLLTLLAAQQQSTCIFNCIEASLREVWVRCQWISVDELSAAAALFHQCEKNSPLQIAFCCRCALGLYYREQWHWNVAHGSDFPTFKSWTSEKCTLKFSEMPKLSQAHRSEKYFSGALSKKHQSKIASQSILIENNACTSMFSHLYFSTGRFNIRVCHSKLTTINKDTFPIIIQYSLFVWKFVKRIYYFL